MKICTTCNELKKLNDYHKQKGRKDGYRSNCKKCIKNKSKKRYDLNREQLLNEKKDYYKKNTELIIDKRKEYVKNNKELVKECNRISNKKYYDKNKYDIILKNGIRRKERYKNDFIFKFKCDIRSIVSKSFTNKGYKKKLRSEVILGCTLDTFKLYLESKFEDWMTWENKGLYNGEEGYGWDIDHIIPLSVAKTEEDIINLNHFTNLQPLCSKINRDIKKNNG